MYAKAKYIRISPKKASLIAGLVRKKSVNDALDMLKFTPKKGAVLVAKVIKSAASNAEANFKQNINKLIVEEIIVNKGPIYRRSLPVSRGRMHPIRKPTAHIYVRVAVLDSIDSSKADASPAATPKAKKKTALATSVKEADISSASHGVTSEQEQEQKSMKPISEPNAEKREERKLHAEMAREKDAEARAAKPNNLRHERVPRRSQSDHRSQ